MIRRFALVAATLVCVAIIFALLPSKTRLLKDPEDFRAFYCAGEVVREHRDPYLAEPLRACENREIRAEGMDPFRDLVVPAPLPAYALVPYALMSLVDFERASSLYAFMIVAAVAITAILIARTSDVRPIVTIAALIVSDGLVAMLNGQIFSFALLALCAGAWELSRGNATRAGIYTALAAIEPHVALPAILGLGIVNARARPALVITLGALGLVALFAVGIETNIEYLLRVLPAHARSESTAMGQYSLTALLYHAGVPTSIAIVIGNVQFAIMCVLGIATGATLAKRYDAPELAMLVPAAFATLGGPFIHLTQMATAIPALFACAYRIPKRRDLFGIAIVLLAIPWQDVAVNPMLATEATIAVVVGIIALTFWRAKRGLAIVVIGLALCLGAGLVQLRVLYPSPPSNPAAAMASVNGGRELAEATWERFIEVTQRGNKLRYGLTRAPTWIAIVLFIAVALELARRRDLAGGIPSDAKTLG